MLIYGPNDLREEIAAEFRLRGVTHESWVIATHSAEAQSIVALAVAVGAATAGAATILVAWLARQKGRRMISILLVDPAGKRQQIVVESPDGAELPLLLAQAREVTLEKKKSTVRKSSRVKLPAVLRNSLLDEVRSTCPSCGVHGVSKLEAHHIDGDRSRTVAENLLMLCATCHGQADKQLINRELVLQWKSLVKQKHHPFLDVPNHKPAPDGPVVNGDNYGQAAKTINNNFRGVKPPRPMPGAGTIEADPPSRSYVHYLGKKYIEWRIKGRTEMGDNRPFNPAAAWNVIHGEIGFAPYKAGVDSLPTVIQTVTGMIDRTPFGSLNRSRGIRNYHTFEEHKALMVRKRKSPKGH